MEMYTISSPNGLYRSQCSDAPHEIIAHLYYHQSFANDQIDHTDNPSSWTIKSVDNLEIWLKMLLENGFTHVYEKSAMNISSTHEISFWLTSIQARNRGQ